MFKLQFETDNAAFDEENREHEVARILREVADLVEGGSDTNQVRDVNGNRIGGYNLKTTG